MRIGLAILLFLAASSAWAGHEMEERDLANGENLYAEHCASCHGASLEGDPNWQNPDEDGVYPAPPHNKDGHTWHHSNEQLFAYTKKGGQEIAKELGLSNFKSGMPGFGAVLTDAEIWDVLAYIRESWPARERKAQASRNRPHE